MTITTLAPALVPAAAPIAPALAHFWDRAIASAGLTVDTASGPVDLVAIERVRTGHRVQLTRAETAYLLRRIPPLSSEHHPEELDARALIAEGLGITTRQLADRITVRNARDFAEFRKVL